MHILLTDITTCPVCGPTHGLILRADVMIDRRVQAGALGCPNCRRQYRIADGIADLIAESSPTGSHVEVATEYGADMPIRIAALLGLDHSPGFALIMGPAARFAGDVAKLAPEFEIIADAAHAPPAAGVSRVRSGPRIPFYAEKLRGVWLSGASAASGIEEAARVLHPLGRLVLQPSPPDGRVRLAEAGLKLLAEQNETLLASRK
jgi:uncharacterized protein YbaR (Trm112 family)